MHGTSQWRTQRRARGAPSNPELDFLEQETVISSGISWAICITTQFSLPATQPYLWRQNFWNIFRPLENVSVHNYTGILSYIGLLVISSHTVGVRAFCFGRHVCLSSVCLSVSRQFSIIKRDRREISSPSYEIGVVEQESDVRFCTGSS